MKKLKELWKKTSILTKIFIIFTAILVVIAISTLPIKQMEGVAFYVFSLWALYFLVYVIYMSGKIAKVKYDKKYIIVLITSIILCGAIYTYIVYAREYIYTWDNQYYYSEQLSVFRAFDIGFKDGIKRIITSTYNQDYGDFLLVFTGGIFSLTTRTTDAFVMTYFVACIIPVIIIFSMIVKKLLDITNPKNKLFLFSISHLLIITFPLLHKAAIMGQPDIFGLFFVGMIILLTMDYDFSKKDYLRWIYIAGATFLTMITRRWYMFWILGYFVAYAILIIAKAILKKDKKELKTTIINLLQFGIMSLVIVGILISPILYRTLKNNYLTTYSAWSSGGLTTEIRAQINRVGEIYFVIIALGIILGIKEKKTRYFTIGLILTYIIAIISFTKVQNMGNHQSLILVPSYILLSIVGIILMMNIEKLKINIILESICCIIIVTTFVGSITENKILFNNNFYSNISLKPTKRTDMEQIGEIVDFIKENCDEDNKAYINSATSEYNHQTFINYNAPENTYLTKVIPYTAATESTRGFPIDIFKCKYIFISNIRLESTGATKGEIITNIKYAVEEDEVISKKFELAKTYKMTDKITYYAYERKEALDEEERQAWLNLFEEQSEKYPDKFKDRIENYKI